MRRYYWVYTQTPETTDTADSTKYSDAITDTSYTEYNTDNAMVENNIETIRRAIQGIDEIINNRELVPEWVREKIAITKADLVTVWDYMQSKKINMEKML